jgi:DNA-directed RNA polymerase specialized sigma24 family protein
MLSASPLAHDHVRAPEAGTKPAEGRLRLERRRRRRTENGARVVTDVVTRQAQLTPIAFSRLLEWLDDGVDSRGQRYLDIRDRLVSYFDRRNRRFPDDLADETLNRIGRTLETSGSIAVTPPARYCYVIARFVLLEDIRRDRHDVPVDESRLAAPSAGPFAADEVTATRERRLDCLDRCLGTLKPDQRELVIEYYRDVKRARIDRRRELAASLGISMNALGIRACRIRGALETCVDDCCGTR